MSRADPGIEARPGAGRPGGTGLRLRIAATAGMVALAGLSAARHASASFDEPSQPTSFPIGDVASLDGIVSGTVRLSGDRLVFFSGDRFRSNQSNLAVNFASGGSLVLCPHSQVQILAAARNTGVMLAFAEGGSEEPFPIHPNDIIMTPDWRIEMVGDVHPGDLGELQLSTTRGDLCLSGAVQSGAHFHISQLVGDAAFDFPAQGSVRIANREMENYPAGCSCESSSSANETPAARPPAASLTSGPQPPVAVSPAPTATSPLSPPSPRKKQRPQDIAGYLRSFVHLIFGR